MSSFKIIAHCMYCDCPVIESKSINGDCRLAHCACMVAVYGNDSKTHKPVFIKYHLDTHYGDEDIQPVAEA